MRLICPTMKEFKDELAVRKVSQAYLSFIPKMVKTQDEKDATKEIEQVALGFIIQAQDESLVFEYSEFAVTFPNDDKAEKRLEDEKIKLRADMEHTLDIRIKDGWFE